MSESFMGEIQMVGFNFAPQGWATCDGQLLPISQNQALFSLLGTTFGGDGRTTFALPDLRGRTPIHTGSNKRQGQRAGAETVTLQVNELPSHTHTAKGSSDDADSTTPNILAAVPAAFPVTIYGNPTNLGAMHSGSMTDTGGNQAHNNMQPFLVVNFIIALQGTFPSRN